MNRVRNSYELKLMRQSGAITALALKKALEKVSVGVNCLDLEKVAQEIIESKASSSFKTVDSYKFTSCITVNEQVVHGLPIDRVLQEGDIVSIDLGALFKGWHTDAAWSVVVGKGSPEVNKFLEVGEEALRLGIKQAVEGNKVGDISEAIQNHVEGSGYSVVRSLVGHGVGKSLHEEPEVPGFGKAGTGQLLKSGQTIAIEVIYNMGGPEVVLEDDGWTISSADGSLAGLFEMTVIIGKKQAEIITDWEVA